MGEGYRSFIVRIRRHPAAPDEVRADVEDILAGRRQTLTGEMARSLSDDLEAAVESVEGHSIPADLGPEGRERR